MMLLSLGPDALVALLRAQTGVEYRSHGLDAIREVGREGEKPLYRGFPLVALRRRSELLAAGRFVRHENGSVFEVRPHLRICCLPARVVE